MINTNGIDKKLKTCVAISIAFHVVLLSLATVAAPKRASGPIMIDLITAGLTDNTGLSGKKNAPIKKASPAAFTRSSSASGGRRPVYGLPAPSPESAIPPLPVGVPMRSMGHEPGPSEKGETVEEHPMAGEENRESATFEAASISSAEDYGGAGDEGYGGGEGYGEADGKSTASRNRHTAQFLSLVREKIEKAKFYPPWARKRGYEGVVRVGFTINKNGNLEDLHVLLPCHCEALNS